MNAKKVIEELSEKYPDKKIIKSSEDNPNEIICEIEPGLAIAVIDKSELHYHKKMKETYEILRGELVIEKNKQKYALKEGGKFVIEPGAIHNAIGNETWVKVYSEPAWTPEDHILLKIK